MYKSKFLIVLLFLMASIFAQNKHTYKGKVLNAVTRIPLEYANIQIEGNNLGTVTNEEGNFEIKTDIQNPTILVSYIGFVTSKQQLTEQNVIELEPISIEIKPVMVYAEDDGLTYEQRFIKNLIRNYKEDLDKIDYYQSYAYSKTKFYGDIADTNKKAILLLVEAISKMGYETPGRYSEVVLDKKMPPYLENIPYEIFAINNSVNVFSDYININRFGIKSPLAEDFLDYYDFKISGYTMQDKDTLMILDLIPLSESKMLFNGKVVCNKYKNTIVQVELEGNSNTKDAMTDSVKVMIKYSQRETKLTVPSVIKFSYNMKSSIKLIFEQESTFLDYKFNDPEEKPVFRDKKVYEETNNAFLVDEKREKYFNVPLSEKELEHKKFVKEKIEEGPFLTKFFMFVLTDLLSIVAEKPFKAGPVQIYNFSNWYKFNKVTGHYLGAEWKPFNNENYSLYLSGGYAFNQKKIEYEVKTNLGHWEMIASYKSRYLGNYNLPAFPTTISSLFAHTDDNYYYYENAAVLKYRINPIKNFYIETGLAYRKQDNPGNITNFSLFESDKSYKENWIIKSKEDKEFSIGLSYRQNNDYLDNQLIYYKGKTYFNFEAKYIYRPKEILKNSFEFHKAELNMHGNLFIVTPVDLKFDVTFSHQSVSDYLQDLNYITSLEDLQDVEYPLSFYSFSSYSWGLKDFLRIKTDINLFNIPWAYDGASVGAVFSYLRSFDRIENKYFVSPAKDIFEYGIGLKGISMFNFYLMTNNIDKEIKFRVGFYYE